MIDVRTYREGVVKEIDATAISTLTDDPDQLLWVDVVDPTDDDLTCLKEQFHLHPLAMEDVREHHQRPKLERYPTHTFIVARSAGLQEVDMFLGPCWLITVRERDADGEVWPVESTRSRFERIQPDHATASFLLYVVLDDLVDGYFNATDHLEEKLETIEERIFGEQLRDETEVQEHLFEIRRRLMLVRRSIVPLREVVSELLRGSVPFFDDAVALHLQDVYDHVLREADLVDSLRDLLGNAADAHLAIISNRMNQVMKKMTSWGAILLGSTLVAGIYGMNFRHMPELAWYWGYSFALGLMVVITVVGFWHFRKKDWL